MADYVLWSLGDLLRAGFSEEYLSERFAEFKCLKEPDVTEYLQNRAIEDEQQHRSRTYLFLDASSMCHAEVCIAGMFTLALIVVPHEDPQTPFEDCSFEPAFLLLQFARSDSCGSMLSGKEMMFEAESRVREASSLLGGAYFFLDCKESAEKLISSYEDKGFEILDGEGSEKGLVRMAKYLYAPLVEPDIGDNSPLTA